MWPRGKSAQRHAITACCAGITEIPYNGPVTRLVTTPPYERRIRRLLTPGERAEMEESLAAAPEHHPVVPGSGGVRKARWKRAGRGKRGGIRVIYYYAAGNSTVLLLWAYGKTEQEDLTYDEKKAIRRCVEEYKRASQTADVPLGARYH